MSQQAAPTRAANPLPSVIYPLSASAATQPRPEPPMEAPPPAPDWPMQADEPDQYTLLDGGVPGFWDQSRHFQPRPARLVAERPSRVTVTYGETRINGATGVSRAVFPHEASYAPRLRRSTIFLPNSRPGAIVARSPMPRDRGLTR